MIERLIMKMCLKKEIWTYFISDANFDRPLREIWIDLAQQHQFRVASIRSYGGALLWPC